MHRSGVGQPISESTSLPPPRDTARSCFCPMNFPPLVTSVVVLFATATPVFAEDTGFTVSLTGRVAEYLTDATVVTFTAAQTPPKKGFVGVYATANQFPLELPGEHFRDRHVRVSFSDTASGRQLFSLRLHRSLMNEPRPITIPLTAPKPLLRTVWSSSEVRYVGRITQRIAYQDLPFLDSSTGRLAPMLTELSVSRMVGEDPAEQETLEPGCMGYHWEARFEPLSPDRQAAVNYEVRYDSGGLFPPIRTLFQFDYRPKLQLADGQRIDAPKQHSDAQ
ncbi:hypothetical protein RBWH47_04571 [Rhodopirellula baltica WH47]|uniref:Uncharacterized protein n=2 Tax=Rhodopirellula baltica TaxID=265606 RepID=F2ALB3_RHOBT|nr:hypothetical protein RBWH47_04571 [Rhodopirellula baltica WH47]